MLKVRTEATIRECLSFLDLIEHVNSGKITDKAYQLQSMFGVSDKDAAKIVVFWENNRKKMQINQKN